jgi:hypothetical protein
VHAAVQPADQPFLRDDLVERADVRLEAISIDKALRVERRTAGKRAGAQDGPKKRWLNGYWPVSLVSVS